MSGRSSEASWADHSLGPSNCGVAGKESHHEHLLIKRDVFSLSFGLLEVESFTHTCEGRQGREGHEVHPEVLPSTGAKSDDDEPHNRGDGPRDGKENDLELLKSERFYDDATERGETT